MRTACAMQSSLITGSMPGMAASTSETWLLGSPPNAVEAPENSFDLRGDLGMHLQADDDLPIAGGAGDEVGVLLGTVLHGSRLLKGRGVRYRRACRPATIETPTSC